MLKKTVLFIIILLAKTQFAQVLEVKNQFEWSYSFALSSYTFKPTQPNYSKFEKPIDFSPRIELKYHRYIHHGFFAHIGLDFGIESLGRGFSFQPKNDEEYLKLRFYDIKYAPFIQFKLGGKNVLDWNNFVLGYGIGLHCANQEYLSTFYFVGQNKADGYGYYYSAQTSKTGSASVPFFYFSTEYQPELVSGNLLLLKLGIEYMLSPVRIGNYESNMGHEFGSFQKGLFIFTLGVGMILHK